MGAENSNFAPIHSQKLVFWTKFLHFWTKIFPQKIFWQFSSSQKFRVGNAPLPTLLPRRHWRSSYFCAKCRSFYPYTWLGQLTPSKKKRGKRVLL